MSFADFQMRLLRRTLAFAPLRQLLKHPRIEPIVSTFLRATSVRESARFIVRELGGRRPISAYRLRESGLYAVIRHGTPDVPTLDEVFYQRQYEPPNAIASTLGPEPRVVDLGANIGLFGLMIVGRYPSARVTAVEPDADNVAVLRRCCELNRLDWDVVAAAAGAEKGTVPFAAGRFSLSRVEPGSALPHVQAVDAFIYLADADLAKLDIEGSEWELLGSGRFEREGPRALVLEYHPHLAPDADPLETAVRLLKGAGYRTGHVRHTAPEHGVLWAWREEDRVDPEASDGGQV